MTVKEILGYVIPGVVALIVTLIAGWLRSRPKLVYWVPLQFFFHLKEENIFVRTHNLSVQNIGREPAEDVEIIHSGRPDLFFLHPPLAYEEEQSGSGEHVLRIKSLGRKEHCFLQMITYKSSLPELLNVRFKAGKAIPIPVQLQRVFPLWVQRIVIVLTIMGVWVATYLLYKVVLFLFVGKTMGV